MALNRYVSDPIEIPAPEEESDFARVDLEFYGVDHSGRRSRRGCSSTTRTRTRRRRRLLRDNADSDLTVTVVPVASESPIEAEDNLLRFERLALITDD